MREADVSGLDMDMLSPRTNRDTLQRDVPVIRLKNDAKLREIYQFGKKLGQGSFGVVYEATHIETQTKWAIKEVCRPAAGSSKVSMLEQEINILKQVNHDCIIHLKEIYDTAKIIYLVTELCGGGELNQLLQRKKLLTEDETRHIIRSLADAVVYLHKRDIVHRDLKLQNILVKNFDDGRINIKVTDFGLSVQTRGVGTENTMTEACGTLIYMAPEIMRGRAYSPWCDLWSIGVVMYMLLCGKPPFVSRTKTDLLEEIMNGEVKFNQRIWANVSDTAKNVLTCLLKVDPAYRMSAKQLLENPWITGVNHVPPRPSNVFDMMSDLMEDKDKAPTLEDLSLTSSKDILDASPVPEEAPTETDSNCSAKTKDTDNSLLHEKRNSVFEIPGTPPRTTQAHASVKPTTQSSAKQRRPQDKKSYSSGQKPASDIQRPFTCSKTRNGTRKPSSSSRTNGHLESN